MTFSIYSEIPLTGMDLCGASAAMIGNNLSHPCTVGTHLSYEAEAALNQIIYQISKEKELA